MNMQEAITLVAFAKGEERKVKDEIDVLKRDRADIRATIDGLESIIGTLSAQKAGRYNNHRLTPFQRRMQELHGIKL